MEETAAGLTLAELLARHPAVPRRTAQRWISQWIEDGKLTGQGQGRARRYRLAQAVIPAVGEEALPGYIPLSTDSIKNAAADLAKLDGVSLNQFIAAAVAEKVGTLRGAQEFLQQRGVRPNQKT
ncbi:MAG: hypothetical protein ACYDDA_16000 [Acidiferrobacteraceae bacterium]